MVEQVGSIDRLLAGARRAGESPLFGLIEMPFIVDVLAILVVVALFIAFMAWALNPTRGAGVINYTPGRYAVSVVVLRQLSFSRWLAKGRSIWPSSPRTSGFSPCRLFFNHDFI